MTETDDQEKRCPSCGATYEAEARFCPVDGTRLEVRSFVDEETVLDNPAPEPFDDDATQSDLPAPANVEPDCD